MQEPVADDGAAPQPLIGRAAWQQALRALLAEPGPECCLYSDRFEDWPLDEPAVVEALAAWALTRPRSCMRMLARGYADLCSRAPRFVRWRMDFGHVLECRELPAEVLAPPEGLWLRERALVALPAQNQRRARMLDPARRLATLQDFDQAWELGQAGFVPEILGL